MSAKKYLLFILFISGMLTPAFAQRNDVANSKGDVEYEMMYDEPYDLYKMWIQFTPLYADFFSTNFSAGYGLQAKYFLKEKFDFSLQYRKSYGKATDFNRSTGDKYKLSENKLGVFQYLEGGATYHFRDEATAGTAKMILTNKRYSAEKWAATVPEHILIPSKVRKVIGIRGGGYYWSSSFRVSDIIAKKNLVFTATNDPTDTLGGNSAYSNLKSAGFYLGGSMARIRNVAVKPKKYDPNSNDAMFTAYADIIVAPYINLDNVRMKDPDTKKETIYDVSGVPVKKLGFRLGVEGMYNREFGWAWGIETGYRPSVQGRSFFLMGKVSLSFGTKFDQKRGASQIVKPTE
jgi:hypothetical protein